MQEGLLKYALSVFVTAALLLSSGQGRAVTGPGNILAEDEANDADAATLVNEAGVFESIRMGIALSMAQCEGLPDCSPAVNEEELKQLIQALDTRIDNLTLRQEEVEDPEGFDEILAIYVNERDNYAHFMEKLGTYTKDIEAVGDQLEIELIPEEELVPEEEIVEEELVDKAASEEVIDITEELQFFEDDFELGDEEEDLEALDDDSIENEQ
jgi:hypothetical protein